MKKSLFFLLAGLWLIFIIFEQMFNFLLGRKADKKPIIIGLVIFAGRIIKSIIVFSLVIFNVFMAISLMSDKKEEKR